MKRELAERLYRGLEYLGTDPLIVLYGFSVVVTILLGIDYYRRREEMSQYAKTGFRGALISAIGLSVFMLFYYVIWDVE